MFASIHAREGLVMIGVRDIAEIAAHEVSKVRRWRRWDEKTLRQAVNGQEAVLGALSTQKPVFPSHLDTPDGRHLVVRCRLWHKKSNPN
ncbi:hypothetical protein GOZ94_24530 [Agrobacterium vitis]|uniref:hypothetical protein n=1 Tax=Agrobacterium vitis TaxID=373 RepID=UPI0012E791E1|nr:hypothetical protein [Agrobacterium vitis]MVA22102.1 hypothetical protein [Agrobacterium vitis]